MKNCKASEYRMGMDIAFFPNRFAALSQIIYSNLILFLCFGFTGSSFLLAQSMDDIPTKVPLKFHHEMGVSAGFTAGLGPAYRFNLNRMGMQLTFAPFYQSTRESYFTAFSFLYSIRRWDSGNLFLYQGNYFMSTNRYESYRYGYKNGLAVNFTMKDRNWNHGLGIGYELFQKPGKYNPFGLSLMAGYAVYKNFTEANFTGEVALMYKLGKVKSAH